MHSLLGNKNQVPIERVFRHGTDILLDLPESAEEINYFFATIGNRTANTGNYGDIDAILLDPASQVKLMEFTPFTCDSLLEILKELSLHKSSGIKDISTSLLFDAIKAIPEVFVKLCNKSLECGVLI